ncbi:MAG: hypothetical protein AMK71_01545 [Nitrospira bacterium SG8_35_4]|nr:MAG: hypothetical protein AMK71_01545 [Nitrospira bacterium SG8_35_4]
MLKVSETAIGRTKECSSNFYCLNNTTQPRCADDMPLCSVDYYIGKTDLIVKSSNNEGCSYKSNFGLRNVCTCPVRHEIYARYNI